MKPTPLFWAKIKNNELAWHDKSRLKEYLRSFKEEQELEIVIRKFKKNRTLPQNSWYHGVILPLISDTTGFTEDECCEVLRKKFLSYQKAGRDNKMHRFTRSTADLTTAEFSAYIEQVIRFASMELGIVVPDPHKVDI